MGVGTEFGSLMLIVLVFLLSTASLLTVANSPWTEWWRRCPSSTPPLYLHCRDLLEERWCPALLYTLNHCGCSMWVSCDLWSVGEPRWLWFWVGGDRTLTFSQYCIKMEIALQVSGLVHITSVLILSAESQTMATKKRNWFLLRTQPTVFITKNSLETTVSWYVIQCKLRN